MKYMVAIVGVSLFLAACSTTTHFEGTRPGSGQAEFSNDYLECQALSKRIRNSIENDTVFTCMQGKGWKMKMETK